MSLEPSLVWAPPSDPIFVLYFTDEVEDASLLGTELLLPTSAELVGDLTSRLLVSAFGLLSTGEGLEQAANFACNGFSKLFFSVKGDTFVDFAKAGGKGFFLAAGFG